MAEVTPAQNATKSEEKVKESAATIGDVTMEDVEDDEETKMLKAARQSKQLAGHSLSTF